MPDDGFVALRGINAATVEAALPGLRARRKTLPPKLFYDEIGCQLFQEITTLPEYYLTRTEFKLLKTAVATVAELLPTGSTLVEYGASDEAKAALLLGQRGARGGAVFSTYVPIDVAAPALRQVCARLARAMPELSLHPIAADFLRPLSLPMLGDAARLGFFPGSTIGNLDPEEAHVFLAGMRRTLGSGARLLISTDLRKDAAVLVPAYDDAAGVTASFNLNLLMRLNREAGANFDLSAFQHRSVWNDQESRIEMHLCSDRDQVVWVGGEPITFRAGETIHTENSYKWTLAGFGHLARMAGWHGERVWLDSTAMFAVHLLTAS